MDIDINFLSAQLLERLANSIHDRDSANRNFCFNIAEVHVVEKWLTETVKEIRKIIYQKVCTIEKIGVNTLCVLQ